jgi:hypothetical protein
VGNWGHKDKTQSQSSGPPKSNGGDRPVNDERRSTKRGESTDCFRTKELGRHRRLLEWGIGGEYRRASRG